MFFASLRGYRPGWLRADLVAGLTVWSVLVPESLAYATIAGVPPVAGLYAAVPALVAYALLGSSRHLVVGPMSATAVLSAGIVAGHADGGSAAYVALTAALALVTGVIGLAAGLLRLGFVANLISEPVLKGFVIGLALTIVAGQVPTLLGVPKGSGDFFAQAAAVVAHLGDTDPGTLAVGVAALLGVLVVRRFLPLVPGSLIVVLLGVLAVVLFDLDTHGIDVVGPIDAGLPRLGLPSQLSAADYAGLAGPAVGVLVVGFAEGLGAAKTYAARAGYDIDADRELLGLGAANLGSGLAAGMVVNGSLSKTAVNGAAGARTQVSGLTVAALSVLTLLFLTGIFERLPEAVLGAVVIAAVIELVDVGSVVALYRVWTGRLGSIYGRAARADFASALAALLGVLVFGTLPGLFIGIAVSLLLLVYRSSRPNVVELVRIGGEDDRTGAAVWADSARHPAGRPVPGVLVIRVESGLFFANAEHVRHRIRDLAAQRRAGVVVLDAQTIPFVDVTAARILAELARQLDATGVQFRIARDVGQVRDVIRAADVPLSTFPTLDEAVGPVGPAPQHGGTT